ncbi:RNA polymerase sigma factor [Myroides pelagicus]|uniref:Sigma-70 family RNA polymerase sigma factor n=1 Tax=Myroides pelagicus TaxID=270914 RepID=A0A7K1GN54_9FLAO|nr:RNA polymerase sigma factor [Myroides pelagicus]MEC4113128.1 RNA polymerase sigma factor [Myroides pelagicus]MTH29823.1 sigma-70 family RNA polymerase sigma factor [Myroides pelagicus]
MEKKEKFESLYNTYWQTVYRVTLGYVTNEDWAKDITQDTFIAIWNQMDSFRGDSSINTWIYRIAVNNCLRQLQRSKKIVFQSEISERHSKEEVEYDELDTTALLACIASLPPMSRLIISLHLEGLNQREIAEVVGVSHANVRVKIHRIKDDLYQKIKKYEDE